jgi:hypothetical protein
MYCYGPVSYRLAVGPPLQQSEGSYPVSLPIEIETRQSRGKLVLGASTFDAGPASRFAVRGEPTSLTLALKSGSVLYAIKETTRLTVTARGRVFRADGSFPSKGVSPRSTDAPSPAMGLVCVESERVRAVNLKGRLTMAPDSAAVPIAPGHSIQWNTAESEVPMPAAIDLPVSPPSGSAAPPSASRSNDGTGRGMALEDWWIFPAPPGESRNDPGMVALPMDDTRWLPVVPPPQPRNVISPWMPPPRRRVDPQNPSGPAPPWVPPGQFR